MSDLADLHCKPGHLMQPCQHCHQRSTGLCRVLVAKRIGELTERADRAEAELAKQGRK